MISIKDIDMAVIVGMNDQTVDNSPMENFFGKMKNEMFYGFENTFESLDNLKQAMIDYIHYHNNFRITVKGKGLTPLQIRNQALSLS